MKQKDIADTSSQMMALGQVEQKLEEERKKITLLEQQHAQKLKDLEQSFKAGAMCGHQCTSSRSSSSAFV